MRYLFALLLAAPLLGCSSGSDDPAPGNGVPTPPPSAPPAPVSAVFVLGDSLSDVGNAAAVADNLLGVTVVPPTVGLCNPADVLVAPRPCDDLFYRKNRVSNGPVAVEQLATYFQLPELAPSLHVLPRRPAAGTNYAVAGATARGSGPGDLARQVDAVLIDHPRLAPDALYVVMIGGNDALDALKTAAAGDANSIAAGEAIVTAAVAAIGTHVERLLDFGARRLVIANVPDLAALPGVRARARAAPDEAAVLAVATSIADTFDRALGTRLDQIDAKRQWSAPTPPVLTRFDLRAALRATELAIEAEGGNGTEACFASDLYRHSPNAERVFDSGCAPEDAGPPRFARFMFWDDIHPTGSAHALIGAAIVDAL
ncbi:MAG TPA: SGNH/GDSL hydrolase family protein [Gammaproteobacteria bacterium]|nr:SGNH/GDSL hydrolase family protein [Gammaproteobacteria bacterium]